MSLKTATRQADSKGNTCKSEEACVQSETAYPVLFIEWSCSAVSALQEPFFSEILIEIHDRFNQIEELVLIFCQLSKEDML